jgi:hypothetical protein
MERLSRSNLERLRTFLDERLGSAGQGEAAVDMLRRNVTTAVVQIEEYLALAAQWPVPTALEASRGGAEVWWEVLETAARRWADHPECPLAAPAGVRARDLVLA